MCSYHKHMRKTWQRYLFDYISCSGMYQWIWNGRSGPSRCEERILMAATYSYFRSYFRRHMLRYGANIHYGKSPKSASFLLKIGEQSKMNHTSEATHRRVGSCWFLSTIANFLPFSQVSFQCLWFNFHTLMLCIWCCVILLFPCLALIWSSSTTCSCRYGNRPSCSALDSMMQHDHNTRKKLTLSFISN